MNEEERCRVNIKPYLSYFRKFHIFLGTSFFLIGLFLLYAVSENAAGIFMGTYPIAAYIYFIFTSSKYSFQPEKKSTGIAAVIVLGSTLFLVILLLVFGFKESKLVILENEILISGMYGETLNYNDILAVHLIDSLPKIKMKSNGFALGEINKGYFKTSDGERIKLLLNSNQKPLLLFTKQNGEKVFFSSKIKSNSDILNDVKSAIEQKESN